MRGSIRRMSVFVALAMLSGCGLAEGDHDDRDRYRYVTFGDPAFEAFCLRTCDRNGDGRISYYEARQVRSLDCSHLGIESLADVSEFVNLRRLVCRGNRLRRLDVGMLQHLERLDASSNGLARFDGSGLRSLVELNCSDNPMTQLLLTANRSLVRLSARRTRLQTLDLSHCSGWLDEVDLRDNPDLTTLYLSARQEGNIRYDGSLRIERR